MKTSPNPIITLTTDFGLKDPYVAEIKAVILGICPKATIVDVTHKIEKFNVEMGAFILASASPHFPKGTIHIAVVDPGVGTKRRPIIIQTERYFYIGPDNGILALAATKQGIKRIYEISNSKLMLPKISNTFHGRDIFAPAAAHLANGTSPADFGRQIRDIVMPQYAQVVRKKDTLIGEVLHIDGFGNVITNFSEKDLKQVGAKKVVKARLNDVDLRLKLCKAYAEAEPQRPLAIIGSHDFLEISINQGNAAKRFKAKVGDKIELRRAE
ncbi:MAG: SAM hydrolase/SAM-dependent halogenase family protein [Candidatus Bathycorpusculaceae bacterium]